MDPTDDGTGKKRHESSVSGGDVACRFFTFGTEMRVTMRVMWGASDEKDYPSEAASQAEGDKTRHAFTKKSATYITETFVEMTNSCTCAPSLSATEVLEAAVNKYALKVDEINIHPSSLSEFFIRVSFFWIKRR